MCVVYASSINTTNQESLFSVSFSGCSRVSILNHKQNGRLNPSYAWCVMLIVLSKICVRLVSFKYLSVSFETRQWPGI